MPRESWLRSWDAVLVIPELGAGQVMITARAALLCGVFVSACTPFGLSEPAGDHAMTKDEYAAMQTARLWALQGALSPSRDLAAVEVELALRGQARFGAAYLGKRTLAALGTRIYPRAPVLANTRSCSDFDSAAEAQKVFIESGGPTSDPHDLDRDGDGLACEWGVELQTLSRQAAPVVAPPPNVAPRRATASQRCFVGPRGGTYTLTSSGRKNYSGC
jgi:hypothetical protein